MCSSCRASGRDMRVFLSCVSGETAICVYIHAYIYICPHVYVYIYICVCLYKCICIHIYIYVIVCKYVCLFQATFHTISVARCFTKDAVAKALRPWSGRTLSSSTALKLNINCNKHTCKLSEENQGTHHQVIATPLCARHLPT